MCGSFRAKPQADASIVMRGGCGLTSLPLTTRTRIPAAIVFANNKDAQPVSCNQLVTEPSHDDPEAASVASPVHV